MNYKNVLKKQKRNKIVKEKMRELKLDLESFNKFIPFDVLKIPMEKAIKRQLRKDKIRDKYIAYKFKS